MAEQDRGPSNEMVRHDADGVVEAGMTKREEFGATAMARGAETMSTALAAQAKASVEARFIVALQRPRDWMQVRERILKECRRPAFAKVARYHKPIGAGVTGPSIRFAEMAMRCMGNLDPVTSTIYDDATKRIVRVAVTDLEANLCHSKDITIDKTVERSYPKDAEVLSVRTNSRGQRTYLVRATDDDLLNKENALVSKALRTASLRLLPGDIQDEAMQLVIETQKNEDARDPDAARKGIVDAFSGIGVTTAMIAEYLGHPVDQLTPDEIRELRAIGLAIKDGEAKWADAIDSRRAERAGTTDPSKTPAPLKDRIKAQAAKGKAAAKDAPVAPPAESPPKEAEQREPDDDEMGGRM